MARSSFIDDFKSFLMQGNAVDLAVGVVIGTAFSKIVGTLVEKLFMPIISLMMSLIIPNSDWKTWMIELGGKMKVANPDKAGEMIEVARGIYIGEILGAIIDFIAIGFVVFVMVRALQKFKNKVKRQEAIEAATEAPDSSVVLQEQMIASLDRVAKALENR
jgi:large conductance mechanosensitive channel